MLGNRRVRPEAICTHGYGPEACLSGGTAGYANTDGRGRGDRLGGGPRGDAAVARNAHQGLGAAVIGLAGYLALTRPSPATLIMAGALGVYQITAAIVATLFIPAMAEQRMLWPALAQLAARRVAFAAAGCAIRFAHAPLALALLGFPPAAVIWMWLAIRSA